MKLTQEETEKQVKDLISEIRVLASVGQVASSWELTKTILRLFDEPFDRIEALETSLSLDGLTIEEYQAENRELKKKLLSSEKFVREKCDVIDRTMSEIRGLEAKQEDMELSNESLKADLIIIQAKLEAIEINKVAEFSGEYDKSERWLPDTEDTGQEVHVFGVSLETTTP